MKDRIFNLGTMLLLLLLSACGGAPEGEAAEDVIEEEIAVTDQRSMQEIAREKLEQMEFLPGSAAEKVLKVVEGGQSVAGHVERFQYVEFKPKTSVIEEGSQALAEIDELALIMNAYPLLTVQIEAHTDHSATPGGKAERFAQMRSFFIKSRLIDQGVDQQMIQTVGIPAGVSGDGSNKERNRVEVRLVGM